LALNAAEQAHLIDDAAMATIINDDSEQGITIRDSGIVEGNSGRKSMYFSVSLAQPSNSFITIHYATMNGTATTADRDYVAVSGQISIRPGSRAATIVIPISGDRKAETDEVFYVQLVRAFGAVISNGLAEGTIYNDDAGKVIPAASTWHLRFFRALQKRPRAANASITVNSTTTVGSSGSNTTIVSLQPLTPNGSSRVLAGPKNLPTQTMNQLLAMGSRVGPRTSDSFAASVDLAWLHCSKMVNA
jgi:hypothetical protein